MIKIVLLFIGFSAFSAGWKVFTTNEDVYFGKVGLINPVSGTILVITGLYLIYRGIIFKEENDYPDSNEFKKCPFCGKLSESEIGLIEHKCIDCGGILESLDGFYSRHPELKSKKSGSDGKFI